MFKWLIALIVIVIAGLALWWAGVFNSAAPAPTTQSSQVATTTEASTMSQAAPQNPLPTAASDTSNAALDTDAHAIDQQMNGLQSDSANVTTSVSGSASQ